MQKDPKIDKENKTLAHGAPKTAQFSAGPSRGPSPARHRAIFQGPSSPARVLPFKPPEGGAAGVKQAESLCAFSPSSQKKTLPTPFVSFMNVAESERKSADRRPDANNAQSARGETGGESSQLPASLERLMMSEREPEGFWAEQAKQLSIALAATRAKLERAESALAQAQLSERRSKELQAETERRREEALRAKQAERVLVARRADAEAAADRWEAKARALQERAPEDTPRLVEVKKLSDALGGLAAANAEFQRRNRDLGLKALDACDKSQRENQNLSAANERLQAQLRRLEEQHAHLQKKLALAQAELARAEAENARLREAVAAQEQSLGAALAQLTGLDQVQDELRAVRAQVECSERAREFQAAQLREVVESVLEDNQFGEVALLRAKVAELQAAARPADERASERVEGALAAENSALMAQLKAQATHLAQMSAEVKALDEERQAHQLCRQELSYIQGVNAQLLEKCEELRDRLAKAEHQALTAQLFENQARHFENEVLFLRREVNARREVDYRLTVGRKEAYSPQYR